MHHRTTAPEPATAGTGDIVPFGWRHPVTGRQSAAIDLPLLRAGRHLRRARYLSGRSQDALATDARVTQSQISRFERALAPAMKAERLVRVAAVLHPNFPIGYCPHVHQCPWQLIAVPDPSLLVDESARSAARDRLLAWLETPQEEAITGVRDATLEQQ